MGNIVLTQKSKNVLNKTYKGINENADMLSLSIHKIFKLLLIARRKEIGGRDFQKQYILLYKVKNSR